MFIKQFSESLMYVYNRINIIKVFNKNVCTYHIFSSCADVISSNYHMSKIYTLIFNRLKKKNVFFLFLYKNLLNNLKSDLVMHFMETSSHAFNGNFF